MHFTDIYNNVISFWSDKIEFDDGNLTDDDGFLSMKLKTQWNEVEKLVGSQNNSNDLMVWSMYKVFHRKAHELFKLSTYSFNPQDVEKLEIEKEYFQNLNDSAEFYFKELAEYISK